MRRRTTTPNHGSADSIPIAGVDRRLGLSGLFERCTRIAVLTRRGADAVGSSKGEECAVPVRQAQGRLFRDSILLLGLPGTSVPGSGLFRRLRDWTRCLDKFQQYSPVVLTPSYRRVPAASGATMMRVSRAGRVPQQSRPFHCLRLPTPSSPHPGPGFCARLLVRYPCLRCQGFHVSFIGQSGFRMNLASGRPIDR